MLEVVVSSIEGFHMHDHPIHCMFDFIPDYYMQENNIQTGMRSKCNFCRLSCGILTSYHGKVHFYNRSVGSVYTILGYISVEYNTFEPGSTILCRYW